MSKPEKFKNASLFLSYGVLLLVICAFVFVLQQASDAFILLSILGLSAVLLALLIVNINRLIAKVISQQQALKHLGEGKDLLTGLPDRVAFEQRIDIECRRCVREFSPLTLMYVDVGGPNLDDQTIQKVADTLLHTVCRPGDLVARINEETFAFILPSTNELVKQLAERCLKTLLAMQLPSSTAVGLCTFQPSAGLTVDSAIKRVESQLAKSKAQGGNCICAEVEKCQDPSVTYTD